jgi:hypothetical protein
MDLQNLSKYAADRRAKPSLILDKDYDILENITQGKDATKLQDEFKCRLRIIRHNVTKANEEPELYSIGAAIHARYNDIADHTQILKQLESKRASISETVEKHKDQLKQTRQELSDKQASATAVHASVQQQIASIREEIADKQSRGEGLEQENQRVGQSIRELEVAISDQNSQLQSALTEAATKKAQLDGELQSETTRINATTTRVANLESEKAANIIALGVKVNEIAKLQGDIEAATVEAKRKETEAVNILKIAEDGTRASNEALDKTTAELSTLQENIKQISIQNDTADAALKKAAQAVESAKTAHTTASEKEAKARGELEEATGQLLTLKQTNQTLETQIKENQLNASKLEKDNVGIQEEIRKTGLAKSKLTTGFTKAQSKKDNLEEEARRLEASTSDAIGKLETHRATLDALNKTKKQQDEDLKAQLDRIKVLEQRKLDLVKQGGRAAADSKRAQIEIAKLEEEMKNNDKEIIATFQKKYTHKLTWIKQWNEISGAVAKAAEHITYSKFYNIHKMHSKLTEEQNKTLKNTNALLANTWLISAMVKIVYPLSVSTFATREDIFDINDIFYLLMQQHYTYGDKKQHIVSLDQASRNLLKSSPTNINGVLGVLQRIQYSPLTMAINMLTIKEQTTAIKKLTDFHKAIMETAVKLRLITVDLLQRGGTLENIPQFPPTFYKMAAFENLGLLIEYTQTASQQSQDVVANQSNQSNLADLELKGTFLARILDALKKLSIKELYAVQGELAQSEHVKNAYQMYTQQQTTNVNATTLMFAWLVLKTISIYGSG